MKRFSIHAAIIILIGAGFLTLSSAWAKHGGRRERDISEWLEKAKEQWKKEFERAKKKRERERKGIEKEREKEEEKRDKEREREEEVEKDKDKERKNGRRRREENRETSKLGQARSWRNKYPPAWPRWNETQKASWHISLIEAKERLALHADAQGVNEQEKRMLNEALERLARKGGPVDSRLEEVVSGIRQGKNGEEILRGKGIKTE